MLIYGVCVSDIKHYNTEKAEKFLNSLLDTACRGIPTITLKTKRMEMIFTTGLMDTILAMAIQVQRLVSKKSSGNWKESMWTATIQTAISSLVFPLMHHGISMRKQGICQKKSSMRSYRGMFLILLMMSWGSVGGVPTMTANIKKGRRRVFGLFFFLFHIKCVNKMFQRKEKNYEKRKT